mmetsp:Transcript_17948/g.33918  ORF Transcript_17948/g.33918 Transcript_17948/m.33918 type:complete len:218 (-) Transcript_17948:1537-2190(-)
MGITPGGVGQQETLALTHSTGKSIGTFSVENLLERRTFQLPWVGFHDGDDRVHRRRCFAHSSEFLGSSIDNGITNVMQKLLSTILFAKGVQQVRVGGDKAGIYHTIDKVIMSQDIQQERFVGLDTTDTELPNGTGQLASSFLAGTSMCRNLDEQGIVVRGNLGTGETRAIIETNTHTAWHTEDRNGTSVGTEVLRGVFGRHTALHGTSHGFGDLVLR